MSAKRKAATILAGLGLLALGASSAWSSDEWSFMAGPGAKTFEGSFMVKLTASFSEETEKGARIYGIRITTKDLIALFKQEFGVNGRGARLVLRRQIGDAEEPLEADLYLRLAGLDYPIEQFIAPVPVSLPEGFFGSASGHALGEGGGAASAFEFRGVSAMIVGDLAVDGFTMSLFSLDGGRFQSTELTTQGLLCKKYSARVTGGMQLSGLSLDSPLLVTGRLKVGPEKVVSP